MLSAVLLLDFSPSVFISCVLPCAVLALHVMFSLRICHVTTSQNDGKSEKA